MGLTVYYNLALPGDQPEARVCAILEALQGTALELAVEQITPLRRIEGSDCEGFERQEVGLEWLIRCFAARPVEDPRDSRRALTVAPTAAYGFGAVVGRCEPVILGLGRYPSTIEDAGTQQPTALEGWSWHACTKTQYASVRSIDHFVRCHRAVIALLDAARALDLEVEVRDDSGYWDHRDEGRLVESVESWNSIVARIAGRVADGMEATELKVNSAVFHHPEFERLEMNR